MLPRIASNAGTCYHDKSIICKIIFPDLHTHTWVFPLCELEKQSKIAVVNLKGISEVYQQGGMSYIP